MADTKQIFALRRQGQLEAALARARAAAETEGLGDVWLVRAYGWALCDLLKQVLEDGDDERASALLAELRSLPVPEGDVLARRRAALVRARDPACRLAAEARKAMKDGRIDEALRLGREAVALDSGGGEPAQTLGWAIGKALAAEAAEQRPSSRLATSLLREYSALTALERPSALHSFVLAQACRLAEGVASFPAFVRWWDLAHLRPEDHERKAAPDGERAYPSLVERLLTALYRSVCAHRRVEEAAWVEGLLASHAERFADNEWLPYYRSKLHVLAGDLEAARRLALPVVRAKASEAWAWAALAGTCGHEEAALRQACLARALLGRKTRESALVAVREELGQLLEAGGDAEAAHREYELAARARLEAGWPLSPGLRKLLGPSWVPEGPPPRPARELYAELAGPAEALLVADLPWVDGVVLRLQPAKGRYEARLLFGCLRDGRHEVVAGPPRLLDACGGEAPGTPVRLRLLERSKRSRVAACSPREGEPWDIYPERTGIVAHVNAAKAVTHVAFEPPEFCLLPHDRFPVAISGGPGSWLALRVRRDEARGRWVPLAVRPTEPPPLPSFWRPYRGRLTVHASGRFGWVGDVHVPGTLLASGALVRGQLIEGVAIEWLDERRSRVGLRAVSLCADGVGHLGERA